MQKAIRLVTRFLAKCQKDKINAYSAQIAFFIILSIIPFLMVFSSMLQYTSITEDMVFEIIERVMPQYVAPFLVTLVKEIYTLNSTVIIIIYMQKYSQSMIRAMVVRLPYMENPLK